MTPEQQQLLDALHRQTLAIYVTGALIFVAVVAVLVVWWVEYREGRRDKRGSQGAYVVGAAEGRRRTQTRHGRGKTLVGDLRTQEGHEGDPRYEEAHCHCVCHGNTDSRVLCAHCTYPEEDK